MTKDLVIYCRYSSDMQRPECCEDQERNVRAALARSGIDATKAVVRKDEAQSGTRADRDQFEKLAQMIVRGEVTILAVDDQARLSRANNVSAFIQDLVYSGGRFLSTTEGIDTARQGWELLIKVTEIHNSATLRNIREGVRRGQQGRVLDDGSAGDYTFGYESYYLDPNWAEQMTRRGPKPKKGLRICEAEAKWVRQIFTWFAIELWSIGAIARELTRQGVPKGHRGVAKGWHHQQVRRLLSNPKYIGQWVWGTTTTIRNSKGQKKQIPVLADQHVHRERPDLRIIDPETWANAQRRLQELHDTFGVKAGQKRRGPKPHPSGVYRQSLLSGLLHCGNCGSRLWLQGCGQRRHFHCPNHRKGLCLMSTQVPMAKAEESVIGYLSDLLTSWPEWMQAATAAMRQALTEAALRLPEELATARQRLALLDKQIHNLVSALADGTVESITLKQRLADAEREAKELRQQISQAEQVEKAPASLPDEGWVQEQLRSLAGLLKLELPQAAMTLRQLLGKVAAHAILAPGKKRGYAQLRFRVNAWASLRAALQKRLSEPALEMLTANTAPADVSPEIHLDLGQPTVMDTLAPEIAAMRAQGLTWADVCRRTGLGLGPAYVAWKRWTDAQSEDRGAKDAG